MGIANVCYCMGTGFCYTCQQSDRIAYMSSTGGEPKRESSRLIVRQHYRPISLASGADAICDRCGKGEPDMATGTVGRLWAHAKCLAGDLL